MKNLVKRTLGFPLRFPSTSVQDLITKKAEIFDSLANHGCICIKNVDFNEKMLVDFTKGVWD